MKNFNPVEVWNKGMANSFKEPPRPIQPPPVHVVAPKQKVVRVPKPPVVKETDPEKIKLRNRERALKTRDALLAKNPNHFRDLRNIRYEVKTDGKK